MPPLVSYSIPPYGLDFLLSKNILFFNDYQDDEDDKTLNNLTVSNNNSSNSSNLPSSNNNNSNNNNSNNNNSNNNNSNNNNDNNNINKLLSYLYNLISKKKFSNRYNNKGLAYNNVFLNRFLELNNNKNNLTPKESQELEQLKIGIKNNFHEHMSADPNNYGKFSDLQIKVLDELAE